MSGIAIHFRGWAGLHHPRLSTKFYNVLHFKVEYGITWKILLKNVKPSVIMFTNHACAGQLM
jgi:hypothetical protein